MNKLKIVYFLIAGLLFVKAVNAQSVDEIISKNITALGGKDKLLTLKTVRMHGILNSQGNDEDMTITKLNVIGLRVDISVLGTSNYEVITQTKGIAFMPVYGMTEPTELPDELYKAFQTQLDIQSPFLDYKQKETTIELQDTEKVNGENSFKLKLTFKNGTITNYFISSKTYLINKTAGKSNVTGKQIDVETTYTNYKQNSDGYWFAFTINNNQGQTNFDKIETNIKVEESIFKL